MPEIIKKNVIIDATVLSTLMSCAQLADFRFNLDLTLEGGKSSSLEMGSLVHTILETYYKKVREISRQKAQDEGYIAGRKYVTEEMSNTSDEDIQLVFDTMDQYFTYYKNETWTPIDVEYVKQAIIYEDDEVRIMWKAKLDLSVDTNNGIYPVDHKTMRQRRDTLALNNQFKGQCLMMKSRGVIINKIGFQKTLKPIDKFTRPVISYTIDSLTEWSQIIVPFWVKQMLTYAEIGYWPPNYTHCENKYGFCSFKQVCEADTYMREQVLRVHYVKTEKWDPKNVEE